MWRVLFLFVLLYSLSGCFLINGELKTVVETNGPKIDYLPIGIPFVLGGHGSSVPLTENLSLTAKHVAMLTYDSVVAYHPDCDIAIIKKDNNSKVIAALGDVYEQEPVKTYGKGLTANLLEGEGKYYLDVNFTDSHLFNNCPASIMDAPIQSGMSGGGVFNNKNELVGIISGMSGKNFKLLDGRDIGLERVSIFVAINYVKDWIDLTIKNHQEAYIQTN